MTPILVVDNTNRVVCRGHFRQAGSRIDAHLRFENLASTAPESVEERAARTVADIDNQVRARLAAVEARIKREVRWERARRTAVGLGIVFGLIAGAWLLFIAVVWALAAAFGFSL